MEKRTIQTILAAVMLLVSGAWATTIYVDDDAPPNGDGASWVTAYRFLQDALAVAVEGDEVRVGQGLYRPDRGSGPWIAIAGDRQASFVLSKGVIARGSYAGLGAVEPNTHDTDLYESVLSGDLAGDDVDIDDPSLFREDVSREDNSLNVVTAGPSTMLEGFVITAGHAQPFKCTHRGNCPDVVPTPGFNGGALLIESDNVKVQNCRLHHNLAEQGGGAIFVNEAEGILLEECVFEKNGAYGLAALDGGGLYVRESSVDILRCQLSENWAQRGGGISARHANLKLEDCVLRTNRAANGGGVFLERQSSVRFFNCRFINNRVIWGGGGVLLDTSGGVMERCHFSDNHADSGGAFYNTYRGDDDCVVDGCVFSGNVASSYGGVLCCRQSSSTRFINCTVAGNRAHYGAFIASNINSSPLADNPIWLTNCIISGEGEQLYNNGSMITIRHSTMSSPASAVFDPLEGIVWETDNLLAEPCFVDPGYWDDGGTTDDPNDDFFIEGDYHLKSQAGRWDAASESWVQDEVTSPCIDAGDPNRPIMYEPFPNGGIINMGAYRGTAEASKSYFGEPVCETIIAGDINGDCKVDINDLILLIDHWTDPAR